MPLRGSLRTTSSRDSSVPAKAPAMRPLQIQATWRHGIFRVSSNQNQTPFPL
jgi:hypothetical protein